MPLTIFLILGTLQLFMMLQGRIMAEYAAFAAVRAGSRQHGDCKPMVHAALAGLTVRAYTPGDTVATAEVFRAAVTTTAVTRYSPEQIAAWVGGVTDPGAWARDRSAAWTAVAESAGRVIGFADLTEDAADALADPATDTLPGVVSVALANVATVADTGTGYQVETVTGFRTWFEVVDHPRVPVGSASDDGTAELDQAPHQVDLRDQGVDITDQPGASDEVGGERV